ncbi:hypothetical protein [Pseudomonas sp. PvP001]|uniref:hypothetical protein n=1 Tax=Pseudomonas sp. PvP001 TaxID=3158559 RepID=UPI00339A6C03
MKRDESSIARLLNIVEQQADFDGIDLPHLKSEHVGRHGEWTSNDQYNFDLLVNGGFLSKTPAKAMDPAKVQLTWAGHDLLDQLNGE